MEHLDAAEVPPALASVIELLTGELMANAVKYGGQAGDEITVTARLSQARVRVSVADASSHQPIVTHPPPDAWGGRGMALVDTLASRWGVSTDTSGGKTVWFEVELAS